MRDAALDYLNERRLDEKAGREIQDYVEWAENGEKDIWQLQAEDSQ